MIQLLLKILPVILICKAEQWQYSSYGDVAQKYQQVDRNYYQVVRSDPPLPTELKNPEKVYTVAEKEAFLTKALNSAWEQYGPKHVERVKPNSPVFNASLPGSHLAHRDTSSNVLLGVDSPSALAFQPWESEWDIHVNPEIPPPREALQPGLFNRFLAAYLDFEVNYHELADFIRRGFVFVLAGLAILVWISIGAALGFLPVKMLNFLGVGRKRDVGSRGDEGGNDLMSDITDRVYLALDGDWLKKLEERVIGSDTGNWLTTHVKCCILPDAKTNGMADCQLVRREKRDGTFQCLTDLIYNFQFGPTLNKNSTNIRKG